MGGSLGIGLTWRLVRERKTRQCNVNVIVGSLLVIPVHRTPSPRQKNPQKANPKTEFRIPKPPKRTLNRHTEGQTLKSTSPQSYPRILEMEAKAFCYSFYVFRCSCSSYSHSIRRPVSVM